MILIKVAADFDPKIRLTPKEMGVFNFLLEANRTLGLGLTFRVAGGWVRDKLLGIPSDDIDIAIDKMKGEEFAKALERLAPHPALGKTYIVKENPEQSKHIGTAAVEIFGEKIDFVNLRKEEYDPSSRIPKVVMATGPDAAAEDAKRRDLTINAMFYNVNEGVVEDYVGGLNDIKTMTLRTPDDPRKTLLEDPLRALRWLRFLSRYDGAEMHPSLIQALGAPDVQEAYRTKVSPTRAFPELRKLMAGRRPSEALRHLFQTGFYRSVFDTPGFQKLDDFQMDQRTRHHQHNLLEHTLRTMDELGGIMQAEGVDPETRMLMNFAVLLHDAGKADPSVREPHPKRPGDFRYPRHELSSADIAEEALKQIGMGKKARSLVVQVIRSHMLHDWPEPPDGIGEPVDNETKDRRRYYQRLHRFLQGLQKVEEERTEGEKLPSRSYEAEEIARLAWMHSKADTLGTGNDVPDAELEKYDRHAANVSSFWPYWKSMRPLLRGDELIAMFPDLSPKIRVDGQSFVSDLASRLREKQATGQIKTPDQARDFVESMRSHIETKYALQRNQKASRWLSNHCRGIGSSSTTKKYDRKIR